MKGLRNFFYYLLRSKTGIAGILIILISLTTTIAAPLITRYDPEAPNIAAARTGPSTDHWFGTDEVGLDIFTRVIYAGRINLTIGVFATLLSMTIGVAIGLIVAYYEGSVISEIVMRIMDLIQAFPVFVFAMVIVAVFGSGVGNIIFAVTFVNAPIYLRLVRAEARSYITRPYIEAARCTGNNALSIIFAELLPVSIRPVLIQASVNVGGAILLTAGLSFIGAGIRPPIPEWGSMIQIGAPTIIVGQWWASAFPGLAIAVNVLGFALFGDFLRTYLNPERR